MGRYSSSLNGAFQALSDPTRRAVIHRLVHGPAAVKELAEPFDMGLPSFMKHIKVLEASGLIRSNKVGRVRTCQIEAENLAEVESWLATQRELWEGRADRLTKYVESELSKEES
jgi:DNA-binding transcriptional ArsR family regulator